MTELVLTFGFSLAGLKCINVCWKSRGTVLLVLVVDVLVMAW